ncbi:acyltransferase family protein [Legionella fairfieldensis]|uniref:acyltransferase family protein n=1 Tax=Legionella fairfieldensis TaxID=45064 RepID=UPI000490530F|nr:heparan-alpha-glucosaminide N-acetyltransferase domain-containing protein [Legionella fairfieldensis]
MHINRLLSIDVFRGITIVLMILVNSPGNHVVYPWLKHSTWNGCTLADLVFPFFIFIVGISAVFSLTKAKNNPDLSLNSLIIQVLKRSIFMFAIGLFLNAFPYHFDLSTLRILGVLQRIAICYFCASLLFLTTRMEIQAAIAGLLLIGYWFIMTFVFVPGYGTNQLTVEGNLAAYLDRLFFSPSHLYGKIYDPEGLLSTFPAIATTLIGNLTGMWLLSSYSAWEKMTRMAFAGLLALLIGGVWGLWFPVNKTLWTSSYVLWTGGFALIGLAFCYWLIEIKGWKKWSRLFEMFGVNAMAAYVLHVFFLKIQAMISIPHDGFTDNLRVFITAYFFGGMSLKNGSLLYALSYTLIWLLVLTILYRRKIFIKI